MITKADIVSRRETAVGEPSRDDFLVLDLDSGAYCGLGEVGGFIWQALDGEHDLAQIAERVCSRYGIDSAQAESDVIAFVSQLFDHGLVELAAS